MARTQTTEAALSRAGFPNAQDMLMDAPIGIYTSTPEGRFLAANPTMATMFGYASPRELIASVTDIAGQLYVDPAGRDEFKRLVEEQGEVKHQEFRMVRRDGTVVWVSRSGRGVRDSEGKIVQYQGFITDLSERKWKESEIKNTQSQYQSLVDNIPGIAFRCKYDNFWTMLYMSEQALELTGYPAGEFIQNTVRAYSSVIHPEDRPLVVKSIDDAVASGRPWDIQYRIIHKDGDLRWMHEKGRAILDGEGTVAYLDGFIMDVTERKRTVEALQEQRNLEKILTSLGIGFINVPLARVDAALDQMLETVGKFTGMDRVYIFQHDASRPVTVNTHEWCADGVTPEIGNLQSVPLDLLRDFLDLLQKGETVSIPDVADLSADHDLRAHFEGQGIRSFVSIPLMRAGRNVGFVGFDAVKARRFFSESELNILQVLAQIVANILERRETEKALRASEQRYRDYILNTPHGLFIADGKGRFLFVNPAACTLSGYSEDELLSMRISDLLSNEGHISSLRHFRDVTKKGRAKGEYDMLTKGGDRKWWSVTSVKISDDRFLGFCHDITLRKMAEEQMCLMASTDDLTGLWNRRFFMQALGREVDRARRYGHVFSVLLMDIDHFKRVNDEFGHDVGDITLRHFATTIQNSLRQVDLMGRLGGEEFGIILPQTLLNGAYSIAERLRICLENSPLQLDNADVSITVSIGVAVWEENMNADEILKMADDALYQAKNGGRNLTVKNESI